MCPVYFQFPLKILSVIFLDSYMLSAEFISNPAIYFYELGHIMKAELLESNQMQNP